MLAPGILSHELASLQKQGIDVRAVYGHIKFHQGVGTDTDESLRLFERFTDRIVEDAGRL